MYLENLKNAPRGLRSARPVANLPRRRSLAGLFGMFCTLCCFFILTSCATTEDVGRLQWDLNELRAEIKDIKKQSRALENQIPLQGGQIDKRLQSLEAEQKATGKAVSELLIKVQSLTTEFKFLTGRFEEARHFSEKSAKELTESKDTLIAQLKELEVTVKELKKKLALLESATAPVKKQKPAEEAKSETTKESPGVVVAERDVKDVYVEAYRAYKAKTFEEAREKFLALLKNYPENEYSDNARFWIAESYYKEKNFEDAILAYDELLKKNPTSDKVPGALLKQGYSFYELNEKETGKIILEKLIKRFPDSKEAKLAKKKLNPTKKVESSK